MRDGDLTYDDFLQRLNIQDVLIDAGYHLNRRDGLRYPSYVRLDSDSRRIRGDKFIVTQQGKCCFHAQQQKVYNIISFIKEQVASLDRRYNQNNVMLDIQKAPATLEILVENTGRVNYGPDILFNRKGITNQVLCGDEKLTGWSITPLPLYKEKVSEMNFGESIQGKPAFLPARLASWLRRHRFH